MSGLGTMDAANMTGVSVPAVTQWCSRNRMNATRLMLGDNGKRCLTEEQQHFRIETIETLREQGASWREIADAIGIHISGLYYWIRRYEGRYPQLVEFAKARRSEHEYRMNRRERSKRVKEALNRSSDWKLVALITLRRLMHSGYSMYGASIAYGKCHQYFYQMLKRRYGEALYVTVNQAISDLWKEHRPHLPEPPEYDHEPRINYNLIGDGRAFERVEWHFDRWWKMHYAALKRA